jgi:predicted double-glycine peptidase
MSRNILNALLLIGVLALGQDTSPTPPPLRPIDQALVEKNSASLCLANYHEFKPSAIKIALPDVQQPDQFSCGAASLMSILAYYGAGPEDYDVLKKKLNTTEKNGTDYHQMIRFASEQGLQADAKADMKLAQLEKCLDECKPVICSIQAYAEKVPEDKRAEAYRKDDNGHYLVAIGYDADNIYFMDPSLTGRRGFLPKAEFDARWHDNEGTTEQLRLISHLGLVIWKPAGVAAYPRFARRID